jgi:putative flippase GtrA
MKKLIQNQLFKKIFFFCLTGGIAAIIDILFFNLFFISTKIFVLSRIGGIMISMIFNFTSNRNITFKAKNKKAHSQAWKFIILYAISMGTNILVGKSVLSLLNDSLLSANIAAISGFVVSVPISFFGLNFWVFKKKLISETILE